MRFIFYCTNQFLIKTWNYVLLLVHRVRNINIERAKKEKFV